MVVFAYLASAAHVRTWVSGGSLPLALASKYKADERRGAFTPDENLIHHATHDAIPVMREFGIDPHQGMKVTNSLFFGVTAGLVKVQQVAIEDGLVLCFSKTLSSAVAGRFYRNFCVRVDDVLALKGIIDSQLRSVGEAKLCNYVKDHTRDHFIKSDKDAWQDEFRLFWSEIKGESSVVLPPGIATEVVLDHREVEENIPAQPRNALCGCRSGMRYKLCHGKLT